MFSADELYALMQPAIKKAIQNAINDVLELAAGRVESMSLYDYDESTRDAAAELVRNLKIRVEED